MVGYIPVKWLLARQPGQRAILCPSGLLLGAVGMVLLTRIGLHTNYATLEQKIDQAVSIAEQAAAADDPWEGLVAFLSRARGLMAANRGLHDVFAS